MTDGGRTIDPAIHRRLDRLAKLLGVALVAVGLEMGGGTAIGFAFGAAGTLVALSTVFVTSDTAETDPADGDEDRDPRPDE